MKSNTKSNEKNNSGFTLVEFAIVLIILGLVVGGALSLYVQYLEKKKIEDTQNAVDAIATAIDAYFQERGHYPCPAPIDAGYGTANFGKAMNCAVPIGTVAVRNNLDLNNNGTIDAGEAAVRVRIGTLPFQELNMYVDMSNFRTSTSSRLRTDNIIDVYNNLYTYAVTEDQATPNYSDDYGAIRIIDEFSTVVADRVNFVVLSHGENGKGAHPAVNSVGGHSFPGVPAGGCTGLAMEIENCDLDFEFRSALRVDVDGVDYYDDELMYLQWFPHYLWTESLVNPNGVYNKNNGNVGMGVRDPLDKLHIKDGHLQAFDVSGADTGKIITNNLCREDGTVCFDPELISGTTFPDCPAGEVMTGIATGTPSCRKPVNNDFFIQCTAPEFIAEINFNAVSGTVTGVCRDPT